MTLGRIAKLLEIHIYNLLKLYIDPLWKEKSKKEKLFRPIVQYTIAMFIIKHNIPIKPLILNNKTNKLKNINFKWLIVWIRLVYLGW